MDTAAATSTASPPQHQQWPRIAFISGHIDLKQPTFLQHYRQPLDLAIAEGCHFIVSNAKGADTQALQYLLAQSVSPSRITVYLLAHSASPNKPGRGSAAVHNFNRQKPEGEPGEQYRRRGLAIKVIDGWHTERDAAMTRDSDYDILWVRSEEETRALYGKKYRPGRVSGTQKNKDRREQQNFVKQAEASITST